MKVSLNQKVALVTGGSRGIGKALVTSLGQAGATVAIHYNSQAREANDIVLEIGNNSKAFQCDLSDLKQTKNLIENVLGHFGKLDILINNAGVAISSPLNGSSNQWLEDWNKTLSVNLTASALLCKEATQHFLDNKSGIIINISSRAAFRGDTSDYLAYAASKGGMVSLTKSIARAYGKDGITAYTIAPGFTRTAMAQDFIDQYGEAYASSDIALDQLTEPKDIAPMVTFLASGMAKHATGTTIDINAGSFMR